MGNAHYNRPFVFPECFKKWFASEKTKDKCFYLTLTLIYRFGPAE